MSSAQGGSLPAGAAARVYVDITEPGRARVTLPNGYAYIAREGSRYSATVDEWDGHETDPEPFPSRIGLRTYKAAATWIARAMGITGALDIVTEREYRNA